MQSDLERNCSRATGWCPGEQKQQTRSYQLCSVSSGRGRGGEAGGGGEVWTTCGFEGYIRMPPVLEPIARIFCTGSKAKEVGW